jgi:glycerol-3-phosphate acyltransferase PlsY
VLAAAAPLVAVGIGAIWQTVAFLSRYSSHSALTAAAATPLILALQNNWPAVGLFTVLTSLVFLRHHANISRLMSGEESKIGAGKS